MDREISRLPLYVSVGTCAKLELVDSIGQVEIMVCDIVPADVADFASGFLSAAAPLAQVILGQPVGASLSYELGDIVEVRILEVSPSTRAPSKNAAAEGEAIVREAIKRSNLEDAVRLALTVDVKWGDYDPEALEPDQDEQSRSHLTHQGVEGE